MQLKEGDKCPMCYEVLRRVKRADYRSEDAKKQRPITDEQLYILSCRCLHAGDLVIGGFF